MVKIFRPTFKLIHILSQALDFFPCSNNHPSVQWQAHRNIIEVGQLLNGYYCLVCISINIAQRDELSILGTGQARIGVRRVLGR